MKKRTIWLLTAMFVLAVPLFVSMCLLCGCATSAELASCVEVNPSSEMNVSDFASSCREVRLEKSESCLISNVDRLKLCGDTITLLSNNQIFLFNQKGKFLNKIGRLGRSNEEYMNVNDFQVYGDRVYILSAYQQKIMEYSVDGTFVKNHELDDVYYKFMVQENDKVVLASQNSNNTHADFAWYDLKTDRIVCRVGHFDKNEGLTFTNFDSFVGVDTTLKVCFPFDYSIYSLTESNDGLQPCESFDFLTKMKLPSDKAQTDFMTLDQSTTNQNVVKFILAYSRVGSAHYLVYPLFGNTGIKTCITHIDSIGNNHTCKVGAKIDKRYPYFCISDYKSLCGNQLVMLAYTNAILKFEEENNLDYYRNIGLKEGDNHIVFIYNIK